MHPVYARAMFKKPRPNLFGQKQSTIAEQAELLYGNRPRVPQDLDTPLHSFNYSSTPLGDAQSLELPPDDVPHDDPFVVAKTPNIGEPGTWYTNPGSGQMRLYGTDGSPVVDFDFDHDHGQGIPHAHNCDGNSRGPGLPISILP